jgi:hypothetical protein
MADKTWIVQEYYSSHGVHIGTVDTDRDESLAEVLVDKLQWFEIEEKDSPNYAVFDQVRTDGVSFTVYNRETGAIVGKIRLYSYD